MTESKEHRIDQPAGEFLTELLRRAANHGGTAFMSVTQEDGRTGLEYEVLIKVEIVGMKAADVQEPDDELDTD